VSQIVDELRRMCAVEKDQYTIGSTAYWTDDQLEGVLANHVAEQLLQVPVVEVVTRSEANQLQAMNAHVTFPGTLDIETATVTDSAGAAVEGVTFHADGRLDFASDQIGRPLYLTGLVYDLNAAAADVLTDWASAVKGGYDVTVDGQQLKRSQRHAQLLAQAEEFKRKRVIRSVRMRRGDQLPRRRARR
jgi:hypothetical protein